MVSLVSVIITTKNEEKNIENCLKSIKNQTYSPDKIEIIIVDNNSSDKTKEIAGKYTDLIFDKGPERSAQRNFGVRQSKGEYFLYLDADMILHPEVISECVELAEKNPKITGLYIPEIITGNSFWSIVRRFERSFYKSMTGPEDWDFDKKIKMAGKVALIKNPVYHNEAEFNLAKYLNKKAYYAKSFDRYADKWGKEDSDIKKQLGFYYRFFGVFIENGKWKKLLSHPILALGMYFLRFMVGIKFLMRNIYNKSKTRAKNKYFCARPSP